MLSDKFSIGKLFIHQISYTKILFVYEEYLLSNKFVIQNIVIRQIFYRKMFYQTFFYPINCLYKFSYPKIFYTKICYTANFLYENLLSYKYSIGIFIILLTSYMTTSYPINVIYQNLLSNKFSIGKFTIQQIFYTKYFIQKLSIVIFLLILSIYTIFYITIKMILLCP